MFRMYIMQNWLGAVLFVDLPDLDEALFAEEGFTDNIWQLLGVDLVMLV